MAPRRGQRHKTLQRRRRAKRVCERRETSRGCIEGASSVQAQRSSVKDVTVLLIGTLCQAARGPRSISSTTVHRPPPASARTVTKMREQRTTFPARWRPSSRATVLDGGRSYMRPKKLLTRVSLRTILSRLQSYFKSRISSSHSLFYFRFSPNKNDMVEF